MSKAEMTQEAQLTNGGRGAYRGGAPPWLRALLLAAAFTLGALAYHHHFTGGSVWGRWLIELLAGCTLLTLAFCEGPAPTENPLRRWVRRSMWVVVLLATAAAIRLVPQEGHEIVAAIAVGV